MKVMIKKILIWKIWRKWKKGRRLCFCLASIKFIRFYTHARIKMSKKKRELKTSLRWEEEIFINSIMWESVLYLKFLLVCQIQYNNIHIFLDIWYFIKKNFSASFYCDFNEKSNTSKILMYCGFLFFLKKKT